MILKIRKLAPGSLTRAIVALASRTGNKTVQSAEAVMGQSEKCDCQTDNDRSHVKLKRTTITVERERLLTLRIEQRSSSLINDPGDETSTFSTANEMRASTLETGVALGEIETSPTVKEAILEALPTWHETENKT